MDTSPPAFALFLSTVRDAVPSLEVGPILTQLACGYRGKVVGGFDWSRYHGK